MQKGHLIFSMKAGVLKLAFEFDDESFFRYELRKETEKLADLLQAEFIGFEDDE